MKGPVLELMAGTGRLSLPLIEAGATLTCVDSSAGMLEVLSRKLARRGLRADVCCMDACRLELPADFELAILPFQSFMEIVGEDRQREALAAVSRCLAPGGRFLCTLHNPEVRRAQVDGALRVVGQFPGDDGTLVVSGFERGGHPVVERLQFFELFGPDGLCSGSDCSRWNSRSWNPTRSSGWPGPRASASPTSTATTPALRSTRPAAR